MSLFRPLKYISNVTESEAHKPWKSGRSRIIIIKRDKTLDIFIVKLLNCL